MGAHQKGTRQPEEVIFTANSFMRSFSGLLSANDPQRSFRNFERKSNQHWSRAVTEKSSAPSGMGSDSNSDSSYVGRVGYINRGGRNLPKGRALPFGKSQRRAARGASSLIPSLVKSLMGVLELRHSLKSLLRGTG